MNECRSSRSEAFLKLYRRLEGLLEKRYMDSRRGHLSVVMEYLDDPDSAPFRTQLDLCREIRNLLSHNADDAGEPVVEPSKAMIDTLEQVIAHVKRPRWAIDFGTPREQIQFAHPNDRAIEVMHRMQKQGYSHMPVVDGRRFVGVFSAASLFIFIESHGFEALNGDLRIADLNAALGFETRRSEKYIFLPANATLLTVRDAFQRKNERNSRVAVVFITEDGESDQDILAMLTPWDVLRRDVDDD